MPKQVISKYFVILGLVQICFASIDQTSIKLDFLKLMKVHMQVSYNNKSILMHPILKFFEKQFIIT